MVIEEKFFKLIPVDECSPFFNLELLYTIRPKNAEPRQEFKNAGYGLTLETAIRKIAHYCVFCKHRDTAIKLKTFFQEYIEELNKLKKLCYGEEEKGSNEPSKEEN